MTVTKTAAPAAPAAAPAAKGSAKSKSKTLSIAKMRAFGTSARHLARGAAAQVEGNEHQVGMRQTDSANEFLNAFTEHLLTDLMDFCQNIQDVSAQPGNAGHMGKSFTDLKPKHFESYIRTKYAPDDAEDILNAVNGHVANL